MNINTKKRIQLQNQRIWNRRDKLSYVSTYIDSNQELMLEMGPSIAPMWAAEEFPQVRYLESCDAAGLQERAKTKGKDSPIKKVHYVFQAEQRFEESIENSEGYQYIGSSHVIEHIPDFVGHLKSIENITNEDGYYFCIVPDKNLVFDKLRPTSSLGDMVSYHIEDRSALGAAIDTMFYAVETKEPIKGWWNSNEIVDLKLRSPRSKVGELPIEKLNKGHFDSWSGHFHVFDPISFSELIVGLREMGLINLSLCDLVSTGHMDFIAIFKNDNGASHMGLNQIQSRLNEQNYPFIDKSRVL